MIHFIKKYLTPADQVLKYRTSFFTKSYLTEPDFIIVGAQKAGTSSLYKYLVDHPTVKPASVKEIHYFDILYSKPENWYKSFFPLTLPKTDNFITGEASPYYMFHPHALERIARYKPGIKIIVMLRDPVRRAISHYHHERSRKREPLAMLEAFKAEEDRLNPEIEKLEKNPFYHSLQHQWYSYKSRGEYITQLKKIYHLFPRENILLLESENFFRDPAPVLEATFEFLGVDKGFKLGTYEKVNPGQYSMEDVSEESFSFLKNHFKSWNNRLFEFLDRNFKWI